MQTRIHTCRSLCQRNAIHLLLGLFLLVTTGLPVFAQGKKSNGGNGKTGPTIRFTITAFDVPSGGVEFANVYVAFQKVNNRSQVVGNYFDQSDISAYFFDPQLIGNQAIDLNDVVQDLPQGQFISQAFDINDRGMILVTTVSDRTLTLSDPNNLIIAGVIDSSDGFRFRSLPVPTGVRTRGLDINNDQDVSIDVYDDQLGRHQTAVAMYDDVQDSWSLMLESYDVSWGKLADRSPNGDLFLIGDSNADDAIVKINVAMPGVNELFLPKAGQIDANSDYWLSSARSVNSWGEFVGSATEYQQVKLRGQTTTVSRSISYLFSDNLELISEYTFPKSLNNNLDFLAQASGNAVLVHRDRSSALNLVALADQTTASTVDWSDPTLQWDFFDINDRLVTADGDPQTDLPQICGHFKIYIDGVSIRPKAFLLTPVIE